MTSGQCITSKSGVYVSHPTCLTPHCPIHPVACPLWVANFIPFLWYLWLGPSPGSDRCSREQGDYIAGIRPWKKAQCPSRGPVQWTVAQWILSQWTIPSLLIICHDFITFIDFVYLWATVHIFIWPLGKCPLGEWMSTRQMYTGWMSTGQVTTGWVTTGQLYVPFPSGLSIKPVFPRQHNEVIGF